MEKQRLPNKKLFTSEFSTYKVRLSSLILLINPSCYPSHHDSNIFLCYSLANTVQIQNETVSLAKDVKLHEVCEGTEWL